MASRKISVNISGSRVAMIALKRAIEVSENVDPQDELFIFEESKIKNAREWKYVAKEDRTYYSWNLKEKDQVKEDRIHLHSTAFQFLQSDYHSLGLLRDICLMTGVEIVYAQVKQAKNFAKIRYCFKVSKYNV